MTTILQIEASARGERSLSRGLSRRLRDAWRSHQPEARIVSRDVGRQPPPLVSEAWIAAAFTPPAERSPEQEAVLAPSEALIDEVEAADVIVIATPMYNYGMPAALKAWFDQVIRVGRTFSFDLARGDWPLEPVLGGKILVVLSSRGEFGFEPGGVRASMNHLEPHIATCAHYLGAAEHHFISIDYQEFGDARHERSVARAHRAVDELVARLAGCAHDPADAKIGVSGQRLVRHADLEHGA